MGCDSTAMKLAFSTNGFTRYSLDEAVTSTAALGYEGVEILADAPHLYAPSVPDAEVGRLKALLDRLGLAVANVNANTAVGYYGRPFWEPLFEPSLANPDVKARHWRIAYTKRCIDIAVLLGCSCVSITSGRAVPGTPPEEALTIFKDSLAEVMAHAAGRGIRVGIEYESGLLVESCEELLILLAAVETPLLGANLDIGHCRVAGEDPAEVIERLGPRLFHIHAEDIKGRKHYHLIPGRGDIDFKAVFAALARQAFNGFVTVELYTYLHRPQEAARQAFHYLRPIRDRLEEEKNAHHRTAHP